VKVGYDAISDGEHDRMTGDRSRLLTRKEKRGWMDGWMGKHDGIESGWEDQK
jgi:hypothetical protein